MSCKIDDPASLSLILSSIHPRQSRLKAQSSLLIKITIHHRYSLYNIATFQCYLVVPIVLIIWHNRLYIVIVLAVVVVVHRGSS